METLSTQPPNQKAGQEQNNQQPRPSSWRQWAPLVILIIAAAIVGWQLGQPSDSRNDQSQEQANGEVAENGGNEEVSSNNDNDGNSDSDNIGTDNDDQTPSISSDSAIRLRGTVWPSKEPMRGNLVLKTDDHEAYLFTSREILPYIGKQVVLTASGSMDRFTITNIEQVN